MLSPPLRVELQPRTWHARHPVHHATRPHVEVTLSQEHQQALARAGIQEAFGPGGSEAWRTSKWSATHQEKQCEGALAYDSTQSKHRYKDTPVVTKWNELASRNLRINAVVSNGRTSAT